MSDKQRMDDDISRLFRSNQHKLDEMPSHHVWMRMERRLDSRRQYKSSRQLSKYTTVVAAVVTALLMITIVSIWEPFQQEDSMAQKTTSTTEGVDQVSNTAEKEGVTVSEVEEKVTDVESEALKTTDVSKQDAKLSPPPPQVLPIADDEVLEEDDIAEEDVTFEAPEMEEEMVAPEPEPVAIEKPKPTLGGQPTIKETTSNAPNPKSSIPSNRMPSPMENTAPPQAMPPAPTKKDVAYEQDHARKKAEKITKQKARKKNERSKKYKMEAAPIAEIEDFHWLVGNWEDRELQGNSYENWTLNSGVLQGEGYYISNGDTTFAEKMQIRQIQENIFLFTSLDNPKKGTPYKLVSFNDEQAIFENTTLDQLNQVVLLRNGDNKFQTILQNKESTLNPAQEENLGKRNKLERARAVRNLSRIKE